MPKEPAASYGDPITAPFWEAASQKRLIIQRCLKCDAHQFYPRPFCISCNSDEIEWVTARGAGTVYAKTTVRIPVSSELEPPYDVILVELEEGPRMLANVEGQSCEIGEAVVLSWREREDAPPLPIFKRR